MERFEKGYQLVQSGIKAEKRNPSNAISYYEQAIEIAFEGNHPYDRLAILYRKNNDYSNEIRVLKRAINVFEVLAKTTQRDDVRPKLQKFKDRLQKTQELQNKSKNSAKRR